MVAWVQRLGKVSAAARQGSGSVAADMEQGGISGKMEKEFKIRNSAGVLTVRAERELSLRDVFFCMGDDKLPEMKRPRLEIHSGGDHWGGMLVALSDRDDADKGMYVIEIPADYDGGKPRAWLGRYDTEQPEDAYVTMEPWREG